MTSSIHNPIGTGRKCEDTTQQGLRCAKVASLRVGRKWYCRQHAVMHGVDIQPPRAGVKQWRTRDEVREDRWAGD